MDGNVRTPRRVGPSAPTSLTFATVALLALATVPATAAAQNASAAPEPVAPFALVGFIHDAESGAPLVGAWVGLTGTDWGSLTNEEGRFRIPNVDPGPLALRVELLGYETQEWAGSIASGEQSLRIELAPRAVLLEGLNVMADRFRSRRNAVATSVFAFESGRLATTSARTALEFIEQHAGVSATSCAGRRGSSCLFVRGRLTEPVVYVDEAPVLGGLEYLDTLAPWELNMVEVYGGGRHIRVYSPNYMKRAAELRILPVALTF